MADRSEPPVAEALMSLLAGAAPLFERARASGLFRQPVTVEATATKPVAAEPATDAQKAALQEIIVAQAIKIHALEAEVARLKA
ncbi:MAG: hypothetical protein ACRYG4_29035 [Janthinobacterium lividum]